MAKVVSRARIVRVEEVLIEADEITTLFRIEVQAFPDGTFAASTAFLHLDPEQDIEEWVPVDRLLDLVQDEETAVNNAIASVSAFADEASEAAGPSELPADAN